MVQIGVKDGRVLEGDFHCLDKLGNIILNNTNQLEYRCAACTPLLTLQRQHATAVTNECMVPAETAAASSIIWAWFWCLMNNDCHAKCW